MDDANAKTPRRRVSLTWKISLFIILLIVAMTAATTVVITRRVSSNLRKEMELRGTTVARNLAANCAAILEEGDETLDIELDPLVVGTKEKNDSVVYAFILDKDGGYVAHTRKDKWQVMQKSYAPPPGVGPLEGREVLLQTYETPAGSVYDIGATVETVIEGQRLHLGEVHIGLSQEAIRQAVARTIVYILMVSLGILVLGIGGAFFLSRVIVRPVKKLVSGVESVAGGNLDTKVPVTTNDEIGDLTSAFNEMARSLKEKEHIKSAFRKYVTRQVVDEILKRPDQISLGGQRRKVAVLFADIRGFTSMSEQMEPEEVVAMLNEYLTVLSNVIFKYEGALDKYMGDCIMANFGAPLAKHDDSMRAVRAALEMHQELERLNVQRESAGKKTVHIGIGINCGEVVAGNMGSADRMDYTVIGSNVNLAQRLESIAGKGGESEVIISEAVYAEIQNEFAVEKLAPVQVKGISQPVPIYRVVQGKSGP